MNRFLRLNKKLTMGFLIFFFLFISMGALARPVYGVIDDADKEAPLNSDPVKFTPQVTIPGSSFQKNVDMPLEASTGPIARYISAIYNYGVGIVGILAALMLMLGGIIWLTAAGSSSKIEQAKSIITSSIVGMALVLTAYVLLKTINPALVDLKTSAITQLEELKCCQVGNGAESTAVMTYPAECKKNNGTSYNLDYLVSADKKTCAKAGCCITSALPNTWDMAATIFSSDMLSQTSLKYKASFKDGCDTGMEFSTLSFATGGLFGNHNQVFFVNGTCTDVKNNACNGKGEQDTCLGRSRYGFCYSGKCLAGEGEENDPCGNDLGICYKGEECPDGYMHELAGGISCGKNLRCCRLESDSADKIRDYCKSLMTNNISYMCNYVGVCRMNNTNGCEAVITKSARCDLINCFIAGNTSKPADCPQLNIGGTIIDTGVPSYGAPSNMFNPQTQCAALNFPEITINRAGKYCEWKNNRCAFDPN